MRIPPSMIVMGLLTAIPFGLAIRQTLHKGADADREFQETLDPSLKYEREMEVEHTRREARYAEEARAEAERARKAMGAVDQQVHVFGFYPATLGSLFDGIVLGAQSGSFQPEEARMRIQAAKAYGVSVDFVLDAKALNGVTIRIDDALSDSCAAFGTKLKARWGYADSWTGKGSRATLDSCTLTIETAVDVPQWIGRGDRAIVPLDAIGKPAKAFVAKLGVTVEADDTTASWDAPGVGEGQGMTRLVATFTNGKVTQISAQAQVQGETPKAIQDQLSKLFGVAKDLPESDMDLNWTGRPPVGFSNTGSSVIVRIGAAATR